jgi:hypothetical protein
LRTPVERQAHFKSLTAHYRGNPIVLYVGAGVSTARDSRYGLPTWSELIAQVGAQMMGEVSGPLPEAPWDAADAVLARCEVQLSQQRPDATREELSDQAETKLQEALWDLVRRPNNCTTSGSFKLLNKGYLQAAPTLRAVSAFCAAPIGRSEKTETYRFGANRRARAVISGNYDPYLESAATAMFKKPIARPVGAVGSLAGDLRSVPVYHIHGYVPHPGQSRAMEPTPEVKQLVLTRRSYKRAWDETDVFNATMIPQVHLLRRYVTLFIGFSFDDPQISRLLRRIRNDFVEAGRTSRWNYGFMRLADRNRRRDWDELGIRPLVVDDKFDAVPAALGALYTEGLDADSGDGTLAVPLYAAKKRLGTGFSVRTKDVWEMMFTCHQCRPGVLKH